MHYKILTKSVSTIAHNLKELLSSMLLAGPTYEAVSKARAAVSTFADVLESGQRGYEPERDAAWKALEAAKAAATPDEIDWACWEMLCATVDMFAALRKADESQY